MARRSRVDAFTLCWFASFTQIFFLIITIFFENPFTRLPVVPLDGRGLNPLLRHPGMIIHPPMLYLGFVGFTILVFCNGGVDERASR